MSELLYIVTVTVDSEAVNEWLNWMTHHHIGDVVKTGYFDSAKIYKVMEPGAQAGQAFEIQYVTTTEERLSQYQSLAAPALKKEHGDLFGGRVTASRRVIQKM